MKGISTLVATLLFTMLAVSGGVVIYAYTMGYIGGFGSPQKLGAITVDTWALDPATGLTAQIRNIGKVTFDLDSVYVNGEQVAKKGDLTLVIQETNVKPLTITYGDTAGSGLYPWKQSKTYEVKLIGVDNTQLIFQVKM